VLYRELVLDVGRRGLVAELDVDHPLLLGRLLELQELLLRDVRLRVRYVVVHFSSDSEVPRAKTLLKSFGSDRMLPARAKFSVKPFFFCQSIDDLFRPPYVPLLVLLQWHHLQIDVPALNNCYVILFEAILGLG
jgi:hypothetical protein